MQKLKCAQQVFNLHLHHVADISLIKFRRCVSLRTSVVQCACVHTPHSESHSDTIFVLWSVWLCVDQRLRKPLQAASSESAVADISSQLDCSIR